MTGGTDRALRLPLGKAARDRLRDQQREESRRLERVFAAQNRLALEEKRAAASAEKARQRVDEHRAAVSDAVNALVETSGLARAAILLGRSPREVTGLARLNRHGRTPAEVESSRLADPTAFGVADASRLAEQHLAKALPQRWLHVQAVAAEAHRLSALHAITGSTVVVAAWLHDLGYAPTVSDTGFHPLDGARYLRAAGWPEAVCGLVAHHTDAARQADELALADALRSEFRDVLGLERDILWAADSTTGPNGERFTLDERLDEIGRRYGPNDTVTRCMTASRPALAAAIARVASAAGSGAEQQ